MASRLAPNQAAVAQFTGDIAEYDLAKLEARLEQILRPGGDLDQLLPNYEFRQEQLTMALAVLQSLVNGTHCMVEAGTGVGKSLAYLIPLALLIEQNKKVVVSTHTISLQTQLIEKDIPLVQQLLPNAGIVPILMKGRANFLCLSEMDQAEADLFQSGDPLFHKLRVWASKTTTGDSAELPFAYPTWRQLTATVETCRGSECKYYDRCFYYKMRRDAAKANLIVVNHALYLTEVGMRGGDDTPPVLPVHDLAVFDEAHHLEDVATSTFTLGVGNRDVPRLVDLMRRGYSMAIDIDLLNALMLESETLFALFEDQTREFMMDENVRPEVRQKAEMVTGRLMSGLEKLRSSLADQAKDTEEENKDRILGLANQVAKVRADLEAMMFDQQAGQVCWGEVTQNLGRSAMSDRRDVTLHRTPLGVSGMLAERLWPALESAVLTSATLSSSGGFQFLRTRLGMPDDALEEIVGSPFDYPAQALLYVPKDLPIPSKENPPGYANQLADEIERLVELIDGRTFVLFTSRRMLDMVYEILCERLTCELHRQGDLPPRKLVEAFCQSGGVLFGLQTFWEGVDIPGEALSCVIIDRLPFAVPDSPVTRARTEAIKQAGGDWFSEFSVPVAQIRLKQGFGRLIRTKEDRGIVCVLDTRLIHKQYGKAFVQALPPATRASLWSRVERFWNGQ